MATSVTSEVYWFVWYWQRLFSAEQVMNGQRRVCHSLEQSTHSFVSAGDFIVTRWHVELFQLPLGAELWCSCHVPVRRVWHSFCQIAISEYVALLSKLNPVCFTCWFLAALYNAHSTSRILLLLTFNICVCESIYFDSFTHLDRQERC
jgi:hypothetical protein